MTTFVIEPGALVAIPAMTIRGTIFAASAEAPAYWVVDTTDAVRHVLSATALAPPDAITTEAEREARRQEQRDRKSELAAEWTAALVARGFTTVEGRVRMREQGDEPDLVGRLRPEAIIVSPTHEDGWRAFMQRLRQAL